MVGKGVCGGIAACDGCTKNCVTIQQRQRDPSPIVTRFFKIMHGEGYSEVLYLPPKFARNVRDLAGKNAQIEDSNGQKWTVKFSYVDGALAFQEGWHKFFEDHQLEYGEMLVFNSIKEGYFIVQIYGISACEINDFNRGKNRQSKRSRRDQETVPQDESCQIIDVNSMDKPSSTPSVSSGQEFQDSQSHLMETNASKTASDLGKLQHLPISTNMEDLSCMLNRDSGYYQGEDRKFLFDLSIFEMGKNSSVACKFVTSLDRKIMLGDTQIREQTEAKGNGTQMAVMCSNQNNDNSCGVFTKSSDKSDLSKDMPDKVSKFQNGNNCVLPSDTESPIGSSQSVERENAVKPKCYDSSVSSSMLKDLFGKEAAAIKKDMVESGEEDYGFPLVSHDAGKASTMMMEYGQISSSAVETKPDLSNDFVLPSAASPFSAEVKSHSFLELPLSIPSIPGKRERGCGKVIYLKDSTERLWPVLYPETFFIKAFIGGWKTFCQVNRIRLGDVCRFQVETYMPCIYRVDVIRKVGQSSDK